MNLVKRAAISLLENALGKTGTVLSVRSWQPATFFEIEAHFPEMSMDKWTVAQHMKVKVAEGVYRDYTPACWDAAAKVCTLLVDAVQDGPGANWARNLKAGDVITHVGVGSALHRPETTGAMYALGDLSALGHFLALAQLAQSPVTTVIAAKEPMHREYLEKFSGVTHVLQHDKGGEAALLQWWQQHQPGNGTIYVAGHMYTCIALRKAIKAGGFEGRIKVAGFWK
ncbi:siderophore-interacting protein [uncultured Chitinophaga sp.]|uniref:siderophore-interacting protein n=1 Tax=uncultured Chitinophaga sp. TaxID=339340 RepID=UPI0025F5210E|nr:siderophore-interacting protein [uncultured Chitinophaga sp.]